MQANALDHVALWVADRDPLADFACTHLGMHVIERTDDFTLVGADARRGKLTLFAAEGPREPGALVRVVLRVGIDGRSSAARELEVARPRAGVPPSRGPRASASASCPCRTWMSTTTSITSSCACRSPAATRERLPSWVPPDGERLRSGTRVVLEAEADAPAERPLLNHIALFVDSGREQLARRSAAARVAEVRDAANTFAVFCGARTASSSSTSSTSRLRTGLTGYDLVVAGAGMAGLVRPRRHAPGRVGVVSKREIAGRVDAAVERRDLAPS